MKKFLFCVLWGVLVIWAFAYLWHYFGLSILHWAAFPTYCTAVAVIVAGVSVIVEWRS